MRKTCINPKLLRLTLEKMVIGVEEPILVKGIGEIVAKVDSGNSGYNVLHGEDLIVQGDIITFKTENKDGEERRVSKKIKETININIGGGHIQERPVVELDVQFGGQDYKKVLFSITNRSDNVHKVLLSKDFVGKELDALIDVTKDNISDEQVNVDYVTEGTLNDIGRGIKNAAHSVSKTTAKAIKGSETTNAALKKSESFLKSALGEHGEPATYKKLDPNLVDEVEALGKLEKQLIEDGKLIREQLASQQEKDKLFDLNVPITSENIRVFKILDYTGGTNKSKDDNADPDFHERLKQALQAYKGFAREDDAAKVARESKDEAEEVLVKEDANQQTTGQQTGQQPNQQNNQQSTTDDGNPDEEIQGTDTDKDISKMQPEEVEAVLKELQQRQRAIFYLICFKKDKAGNDLVNVKDKIGEYQSIIDSYNNKISRGKNWSLESFKPFAKQLAQNIKVEAKGFFALCTKPMNQRSVEFLIDDGLFNGAQEKADNDKATQAAIDAYNEANEFFKKQSGMDLNDANFQTFAAQQIKPVYDGILQLINNSAAFRNYIRRYMGYPENKIKDPSTITKEEFDKMLNTRPTPTN